MFKTKHHFIFFTDIHMKLPEVDDVDNFKYHIASLMFKELIKDNTKINFEFDLKDGDDVPSDKMDKIINDINKILFQIEDTLGKMNLNYF